MGENHHGFVKVYGINMFSDLTDEEFHFKYASGMLSMKYAMPCTTQPLRRGSLQLERSLDWRQKNAVTPVKSQGQCGSCWAFSIVGALESQYAIRGQFLDLSEQQLVDCEPTNTGCDALTGGGIPSNGGLYIVEKGIMSESDYPYRASKGQCAYDASKALYRASSCLQLDGTPEEELKIALAEYGPISIAIDARTLASYSGGIFRSCVSQGCDHAVLLVGYNDEGKDPYWILKNSWGPEWGEQGHFRIPMGIGACLISQCMMVALQV